MESCARISCRASQMKLNNLIFLQLTLKRINKKKDSKLGKKKKKPKSRTRPYVLFKFSFALYACVFYSKNNKNRTFFSPVQHDDA